MDSRSRDNLWLTKRAGLAAQMVAIGTALYALLGPLGFELTGDRATDAFIEQRVGMELFAVMVAAPVLMWAGFFLLQERGLGFAMAAGTSLYVVVVHASAMPGEDAVVAEGGWIGWVLNFVLVLGGSQLAVLAWARLDFLGATPLVGRMFTYLGLTLTAVGSGLALAWIAKVPLVYTGQSADPYLADPALVCLAVLIPALIGTGVGLLFRQAAAVVPALVITPFLTCLVGSAMFVEVALDVRDVSPADPVTLGLGIVVTLLLTAFSWQLFRAISRQCLPVARTGSDGVG